MVLLIGVWYLPGPPTLCEIDLYVLLWSHVSHPTLFQPEVLKELLAGKSMEEVVAERIKQGKTQRLTPWKAGDAAPAVDSIDGAAGTVDLPLPVVDAK